MCIYISIDSIYVPAVVALVRKRTPTTLAEDDCGVCQNMPIVFRSSSSFKLLKSRTLACQLPCCFKPRTSAQIVKKHGKTYVGN